MSNDAGREILALLQSGKGAAAETSDGTESMDFTGNSSILSSSVETNNIPFFGSLWNSKQSQFSSGGECEIAGLEEMIRTSHPAAANSMMLLLNHPEPPRHGRRRSGGLPPELIPAARSIQAQSRSIQAQFNNRKFNSYHGGNAHSQFSASPPTREAFPPYFNPPGFRGGYNGRNYGYGMHQGGFPGRGRGYSFRGFNRRPPPPAARYQNYLDLEIMKNLDQFENSTSEPDGLNYQKRDENSNEMKIKYDREFLMKLADSKFSKNMPDGLEEALEKFPLIKRNPENFFTNYGPNLNLGKLGESLAYPKNPTLGPTQIYDSELGRWVLV